MSLGVIYKPSITRVISSPDGDLAIERAPGYAGRRHKNVKYMPYDHDLAMIIIDRIADGEFTSYMCAEEGMPRQRDLRAWTRGEGGAPVEFAFQYFNARKDAADAEAEAVLVTAFEAGEFVQTQSDMARAKGENPRQANFLAQRARKEAIEVSKLKVQALQWSAARKNANRWGDRIAIDQKVDVAPTKRADVAKLTDEQLRKISDIQAEISEPKQLEAGDK